MPASLPETGALLYQVRTVMRLKQYSIHTEKTYVSWIHRFILFHDHRHPGALGGPEIAAFLTHLAAARGVAAATQSQARSALLFLYRDVLKKDLDLPLQAVQANRERRLPTVLTRREALEVIAYVNHKSQLPVKLLYGSGLRVIECVRLRVKDIDFEHTQLVVRDRKGQRDRRTVLPEAIRRPLRAHLQRIRQLHARDLEAGHGSVYLPPALERKYGEVHHEWALQYVFPAARRTRDPRSRAVRRHHIGVSSLQKAVRRAARMAGIPKRVSCHTFRHSFAIHLLQAGHDIRTVQELLGHKDPKTTLIYAHLLNRERLEVRSPLDCDQDPSGID